VGSWYADDRAVRAVRRYSEGIAFSLDDECRHPHRFELGQAALLRSSRRVEREGEAENGRRTDLGGRPAGHAGAGRPAAGYQRDFEAELRDDRDPGGVELVGRSGAPPAGHAVGLLDERHGELCCPGGVRRADEVGRADPAAGPMPEHERGDGRVHVVEVNPGGPAWCVELEDLASLAS